jgi:hypothetical protein
LRKAEAHKVLQRREEEARQARREEDAHRAKVEEARQARRKDEDRRAKLEEERARKAPSSSPPVSPPRQDNNFGLFKRRKDDGLTPETQSTPMETSKPPQLSLQLGDRPAEVIKPGGGGIVLGIDAPTSAVNAGDRVSSFSLVSNVMLIQL